jgi:uncharacterized RDD family membrane protein YckC
MIDACQCLLYFGKQRFLIVQNSLIHVYFLEIHRLFFRLFNVVAGLDGIFGGRGASSQGRDMLLNFSLLLFQSLSHDSQVNCHLFVSFLPVGSSRLSSMTGSRAALMITGGIVGLLLAAGTILLSIAGSGPSDGSVNVLYLIFLLWTLGWIFGPLLTGGENTLRPEYFRLLPISPRRLAVGLLVATFVDIAPLVSLLAFSGIVLSATHLGAFPTLVAIVAVPLQFVSIILLSRVISRAVGQAMQYRLGMELGALLIGLGIAFVSVGWWALPAVIQAVSTPLPAFSTLLAMFADPTSSEFSAFLLLVLPVLLYFALFECSSWQATWGKRKMGLRVITTYGARLSLPRSLTRSLLKLLPWELTHACLWRIPGWPLAPTTPSLLITAGLALVWILVGADLVSLLVSKKHQALYDWIAGTYVLLVPRPGRSQTSGGHTE